MFENPSDDPQTAEELILYLNQKFDGIGPSHTKYVERFRQLGPESIDIIESKLSNDSYNLYADHLINLMAQKYRQYEDQLSEPRKNELVDLMIVKSQVANRLKPLSSFVGINHPYLRVYVDSLNDDPNESIRRRAGAYIKWHEEQNQPTRMHKESSVGSLPELDSVGESTLVIQGSQEFVPALKKVTSEANDIQETKSNSKSTSWWPWALGGLVLLAAVFVFASRGKKQRSP